MDGDTGANQYQTAIAADNHLSLSSLGPPNQKSFGNENNKTFEICFAGPPPHLTGLGLDLFLERCVDNERSCERGSSQPSLVLCPFRRNENEKVKSTYHPSCEQKRCQNFSSAQSCNIQNVRSCFTVLLHTTPMVSLMVFLFILKRQHFICFE